MSNLDQRKTQRKMPRNRLALDSATSAIRQTRQKNAAEDCLLRHQLDSLDRQRRRSLQEFSGTEAKLLREIGQGPQSNTSPLGCTPNSPLDSRTGMKGRKSLKPDDKQDTRQFFPLEKVPVHIPTSWQRDVFTPGCHGHAASPRKRPSGSSENHVAEFTDKDFKNEVDALVQAQRLRFIHSNKDALSKSFYDEGEKTLVDKHKNNSRSKSVSISARSRDNIADNEAMVHKKGAKTVRFLYTHSDQINKNVTSCSIPPLMQSSRTRTPCKQEGEADLETDRQGGLNTDIPRPMSMSRFGDSGIRILQRETTQNPVKLGGDGEESFRNQSSPGKTILSKPKLGSRRASPNPILCVQLDADHESAGNKLLGIAQGIMASQRIPQNGRRHSMCVDRGVYHIGTENTREQWEELSQYLDGVRHQHAVASRKHSYPPPPNSPDRQTPRDRTVQLINKTANPLGQSNRRSVNPMNQSNHYIGPLMDQSNQIRGTPHFHSQSNHRMSTALDQSAHHTDSQTADQSQYGRRRHSDGTFLSLANVVRQSKIIQAASKAHLGRRYSEIPEDHPCALADQTKRNTSVMKLAGMHTILQNSAVALSAKKSL